MKTFTLEIITKDGIYLKTDVSKLIVRNSNSVLGILPGHQSLISSLIISSCIIEENGNRRTFAIGGGLLNVKKNEKVTLLVDSIEEDKDIDIARAEASKHRAEERLSSNDPDIDIKRAELALKRALNRIDIASR